MKEPLWLRRAWVDALHFQQLKRFGGLFGSRDEGAIESALARPINQFRSAKRRDLVALAAAYAFGLSRSLGYSDGNKRVGFMAMAVFLELNGASLEAEESEVVVTMLSLAADEVSEPELADWVRARIQPGSSA